MKRSIRTDDALVSRIVAAASHLEELGEQHVAFRTSSLDFYRYPEVEREIRSIAIEVVKRNPEMLSVDGTELHLTYQVVQRVFDGSCWDKNGDKMSAEEFAAQHIGELINYEAFTQLQAPVLHFVLERLESGERAIFDFGEVRFTDFNPYDFKDDLVLGWLVDQFDGRMSALATVLCPGDGSRMLDYFNEKVGRSLRIILGALWPKLTAQRHPIWPPSVVGSGLDPGATPYRRAEHSQFSISRGPAHGLGGGFALPKDLRDLWGNDDYELLMSVAASGKRSQLEEGVLTGFGWLGDALKPDTSEMRFVKIATALETFVGPDDSRDPKLTGRGITATLAERSAFLVGETSKDRKRIDERIRRDYGNRSSILHHAATVDSVRIDAFGDLVWRVGRALVGHLHALKTTDDLARWALDRRYESSDVDSPGMQV